MRSTPILPLANATPEPESRRGGIGASEDTMNTPVPAPTESHPVDDGTHPKCVRLLDDVVGDTYRTMAKDSLESLLSVAVRRYGVAVGHRDGAVGIALSCDTGKGYLSLTRAELELLIRELGAEECHTATVEPFRIGVVTRSEGRGIAMLVDDTAVFVATPEELRLRLVAELQYALDELDSISGPPTARSGGVL
jgi:hypothetical protein